MISCAETEALVLEEPDDLHSASPEQSLGFQGLYRAHFDEVMRFILRFGVERHEAEDLTQRVFMIAYRRGCFAEPIERPEAWLRGVAIRLIREHYRWWRVRRAASWVVEHGWAGRSEYEFCPEREAAANEALSQVRSVLRQMSSKLRDAMVLLDIEDLTPREAAELLGVPLNTLRSRRLLAHEEFKRLWDRLQQRRVRCDD